MDVGFGTSGLRGTASALLAGAAATHVDAFCRFLVESGAISSGGEIHVGADRRASSPALVELCLRAIADCGLRPVNCGAVPTPALAHFAMARHSAAIMVTGSHIPADRNGLKFFLPDGEITKKDEQAIAAAARDATPNPDGGTPDMAGEACTDAVIADWLARYRGVLDPDALAGLRIGIDEHSTVAAGPLREILSGFGADIVPFGRLDRFEPLDTEAVDSERLRDYATRLERDSLHAIATADPDGDRPLLVDETGKPLRGDLLGWITARWLGADAVAVPVNANSAIQPQDGVSVARTRIGSPYVLEALDAAKKAGAEIAVGFEPNGGFMLASPVDIDDVRLEALPTRDAVLPMIATLHTAVSRGLPLSALAREFGFRAAASDRIADFPVERSRRLMSRLGGNPGFIDTFIAPVGTVAQTDWTDGLRITLANGSIVHLRPSGNAPEMRCYVEAGSDSAAGELLAWGLARIMEMAGGE